MPKSHPPEPPAALRGLEEAERQLRVAQRLHAEGSPAKPWEKLAWQDRRRWIDRACDAAHRDVMH